MKHGAFHLILRSEGQRGVLTLCGEASEDVVYENFQGISGEAGFRDFYAAIECPKCKNRIEDMIDELRTLIIENGDEEDFPDFPNPKDK